MNINYESKGKIKSLVNVQPHVDSDYVQDANGNYVNCLYSLGDKSYLIDNSGQYPVIKVGYRYQQGAFSGGGYYYRAIGINPSVEVG